MINPNIIKLVPLLEAGKTLEALQAIESRSIDLAELSEGGNDLFHLAFYHKQFEVADKLLEFNNSNNQIFPLKINKKISNLTFINLIQQSNQSNTFVHNIQDYMAYIEKNNLILNVDFKDLLDTLRYENFRIFYKQENVDIFKYFLKNSNSLQDIKKLDARDIIKKISFLNSPILLNMYYEICEFDKLPIQEHPSFKLLKDIAINPTKYYDFHIISNDSNLEDKIRPDSIIKIKNEFEKIENKIDFITYFKKDKKFLPDLLSLHVTPILNKNAINPLLEIDNLHASLIRMNEEFLASDPNKFLPYYLTNWPVSYFAEKSINNQEVMSINQIDSLKNTLSKYCFKSIFIYKDKKIDDIITFISDSIPDLKEHFNLEDSEVGNSEISLGFFEAKYNDPAASYNIHTHEIKFHQDRSNIKNISTFIHEYTHYLQYQNPKLQHHLESLKHKIRPWVDYAVRDFAENFFNYLAVNHFEPVLNKNKEEWLLFLESAIPKYQDGRSLLKFITENSSHLLPLDEYNFFKDCNYKSEIEIIDVYYRTQHNKDYSYEYSLWRLMDDKIKLKDQYHYQYWSDTAEIHARLNEEIYNERKNSVKNDINPVKLDKIKYLIKNLNDVFVAKYKEKNTTVNKNKM